MLPKLPVPSTTGVDSLFLFESQKSSLCIHTCLFLTSSSCSRGGQSIPETLNMSKFQLGLLYLDQEVIFNRLQGFRGLFAADCVAFSAGIQVVEIPIRMRLWAQQVL